MNDVATMNIVSIDEFNRVEMRVGKVVEAMHPEKSEKLIRLVVDFGLKDNGDKKDTGDKGEEHEIRVIFTGVRPFGYTKDDFLGKQFFFVTNLAPRKMPSYVETPAGKIAEESQGMILAVDGLDKKPIFVSADRMPIGAKVR